MLKINLANIRNRGLGFLILIFGDRGDSDSGVFGSRQHRCGRMLQFWLMNQLRKKGKSCAEEVATRAQAVDFCEARGGGGAVDDDEGRDG